MTTEPLQAPVHQEHQGLALWVWAMVGLCWTSVLGTSWAIWRQWSATPVGERAIWEWTGPIIGIVVMALIHVVLGGTKVSVTPSEVRIAIGHWPWPVRINMSEIRAARPLTYRPLLEMGGWGVRRGKANTWAYTASGNRGLLLYLGENRRALIGSDDPETLGSVLARLNVPLLDAGSDITAPAE